jgi:predicted acyl esterase
VRLRPDLRRESCARTAVDYERYIAEHALDDESCRARSPDGRRVKAPFLSAANWGGQGLHTRGNFEGFMRAASREKWLEAHGGAHWENFYTRDGERLQRALLRPLPQGRGHRLDAPAARRAQDPPSRREVRRAPRERVAARAHALDALLPESRPDEPRPQRARSLKN